MPCVRLTMTDLMICSDIPILKRFWCCVLFLHQTTTTTQCKLESSCCISFCSYIKPQHAKSDYFLPFVVFRFVPTSNHNAQSLREVKKAVVFRFVPTSNHNRPFVLHSTYLLYFVLFLHQTTTYNELRQTKGRLYFVLFLHQTTTEKRKN